MTLVALAPGTCPLGLGSSDQGFVRRMNTISDDMSGPVASNLVLLSDLGTIAQGTKVRFLGCVDEYVVPTATLRLKHKYPAASSTEVVNVDIVHVLERIRSHEMEVGTWINVIGYVERRKEKGVFVQAITVWDAGLIDLSAYEKAIEAREAAA
ncbi:hypothetical protein E8E13_008748 [Curvularia kusanoi]|uniref:CST complex subunit Ten1 n=1 Tax=Curvularia kusanoi TaxID=90978 RepID=A0A9P4TJ77_CURKU|nr:hypothetical protein E8E13_008748 [Curvularia kusanoi]